MNAHALPEVCPACAFGTREAPPYYTGGQYRCARCHQPIALVTVDVPDPVRVPVRLPRRRR